MSFQVNANVGVTNPGLNVGYQQPVVQMHQQPVVVQQPVMMAQPAAIIVQPGCQTMLSPDHPISCGRYIPRVSTCSAIMVLIFNILFPGFGTMLLGCCVCNECCCWFWVGMAQSWLACVIVGWIWAIVFACQAITVSNYPVMATAGVVQVQMPQMAVAVH